MNFGYDSDKNWGKAFSGSFVFHAVALIALGLVVHYTPPAEPADQSQVLVELYEPGGGGGETGPEETPEEAMEEFEEVYEEDVYEPQEQPVFDPTVPPAQVEKPKPVKRPKAVRKRGRGTGHGSGQGSGTGTGQGTGTGSGIGSGTGAGRGESSNPSVLSSVKPRYPSGARSENREGTVVVGVRVGTDGRPASVWVESGSGYSDLDEAALNAIRKWRFVPGKSNGTPVEKSVQIPIQFNLVDA